MGLGSEDGTHDCGKNPQKLCTVERLFLVEL
jgi:hypothetical protein